MIHDDIAFLKPRPKGFIGDDDGAIRRMLHDSLGCSFPSIRPTWGAAKCEASIEPFEARISLDRETGPRPEKPPTGQDCEPQTKAPPDPVV